MAEELGDSVYKINEEGIEEALSFDKILDLPNINDCLDEDIMFNFKTIFTSKFGLNMRNIISHGFYEDNDFFSLDALYTWWFIFKICYMFSYETYNNIISSVVKKIEKLIPPNSGELIQ